MSIMKKSTARYMNNNHHKHVHIVLRIHTKVPSCRFHVFNHTQRVARNHTQRVARLNGFLSQPFDRAISLAHVRSPGMYQHAVAHPHTNIMSDLWWLKSSYMHPHSPQQYGVHRVMRCGLFTFSLLERTNRAIFMAICPTLPGAGRGGK